MNEDLNWLKSHMQAGKMSRREFIGRAGSLGVGAVAAAAIWGKTAEAAGPIKGGHLKLGVDGGESTDALDPALASNEVPFQILRHYGETLVNVSPSNEIEARLAEKFDSADALTWRFKIRKGVEFHNGKPLTADDVLKTIQRHGSEGSKSGALGLLKDIADMSADGDTFKVTLKAPNADFPYYMADFHLVIQPNGGTDNPNAGIGTGPYTIEVNEPGVRHGFKKFANYWDPNIGHVAESEILVINDATARTGALQSGEVHMINRIDPKVADLLKNVPGIAIKNISGRGHQVFVMHIDTAPFDNNDLRMALKLAINRQEMVDKILRGYGSIGNDMPVNSSYAFFDASIPQREYDPKLAAEYYRKSGHDGSPILLRTADGAFPAAVEAAQLYQQSAAAAGIPLQIKREPNDGYWSEVWNKQPFCASYWAGRPTQDQVYTTTYLSTSDWNDTRFKRPDFDKLLIAARSELNPDKRKALYSNMGRMLRDEGGVIAPMFNDWIDAVSDNVGGFIPDANWGLMNNMAALKCWLVA